MTAWLEQLFRDSVQIIPIELFVFVASILEEIIPPIPAFPVTILAGNFAFIQDYSVLGVFLVAVVGAAGKTIGAVIVYEVVRSLESVFLSRYGRFFGVTEQDLTRFGEKFESKVVTGYGLLILLRTIPIMPSAITTVASGMISIPRTMYITCTFIGSVLRYSMYVYAGYYSSEFLVAKLRAFESGPLSDLLIISFAFAILVTFVYLYLKRKRETSV